MLLKMNQVLAFEFELHYSHNIRLPGRLPRGHAGAGRGRPRRRRGRVQHRGDAGDAAARIPLLGARR